MTFRVLALSTLAAAALVSTAAQAEPITSFTGTVTSSDATELGRASRSGTPQSWTHDEAYTGQINPTTTYYYTTYTIDASNFTGAPYVDISVFDENNTAGFFVSAFEGSYNPANRGANWLGDEGSSGNYTFFAGDPGDARDFEVTLTSGEDLVLLVNSTLGGANGLDQPFDISINAYADTMYDDPAPMAATPEPGTLLTTMTGLLSAVGVMRRKFAARA